MPKHSVYILFSPIIDRFYIGYTSSFKTRFTFHNHPIKNNIWTRRGQPWQEYLLIDKLSKSQAIRIERHIKRMKSRKYIEELKRSEASILLLKRKFA